MIPPEDSQNRILSWMQMAHNHDVRLYQHSLLVARLSAAFSAHLNFSSVDRSELVRAALLHDIGKTKIPRDLLHKPTELTLSEMRVMRTHPDLGSHLLAAEGGHSEIVLSVVRQHHERLDGSGYPRGILAPDISDAVRMVTLCDVYAAMTEHRPYATPFTPEGALQRMATKKSRLDLDLLGHFSEMLRKNVYVSY